MSIDFFTLIAQIFNLLLLLFLLRKFLYLPVLKIVEERQKVIKSELQKAADEHARALKLSKECSAKMADIDRQRQVILDQTQEHAQELAQKLAAEAHKEYENARLQWKNKLLAEQKTLELALQNLVVEHFDAFARSALEQMADLSLHALIVEKFKQKIETLDDEEKKQIAAALKTDRQIKILSALPLNDSLQKDLTHFMHNSLQVDRSAEITFAQDSALICGIALRVRDQMISWNLASYMENFHKQMSDQLENLLNRGKNA